MRNQTKHHYHHLAMTSFLGLQVFNLSVFQVSASVPDMLSKRGRASNTGDIPKGKRLRRNLGDLILENVINGERAQTLFAEARSSGSFHIENLARIRREKHVHRNFLTKLLKRCQWLRPCFASIHVWDPKVEREVEADLPLLPPHEFQHAIGSALL